MEWGNSIKDCQVWNGVTESWTGRFCVMESGAVRLIENVFIMEWRNNIMDWETLNHGMEKHQYGLKGFVSKN